MDTLVKGVQKELPWNSSYADDVVLMGEIRENMEEDLERWRYALERRGMKVSRSKTEYLCANEMDTGQQLTMKLQDVELPKAQDFKYFDSTVQKDGGCEKEVKKRIQAGWNSWKRITGVICDKKVHEKLKGELYRMVVRPGSDVWTGNSGNHSKTAEDDRSSKDAHAALLYWLHKKR